MSDLTQAAMPKSGSDQPSTAENPAENSTKPDSMATDGKQGGPGRTEDFSQLPGYSRSLLRIPVPVSVRLASKKEAIKNIIELAPGAIIKFDKACDQPLRLYVGDQEVAEGEAVKVGDCFGFRLSQMLMPKEHFRTVRQAKTQ